MITFKLYTLHLVHKYTRHKLTNFITSIIHYNVHTLALYSQNACTVLYCTAVGVLYIYTTDMKPCGILKYTVSLAMVDYQNTCNTTAHVDIPQYTKISAL